MRTPRFTEIEIQTTFGAWGTECRTRSCIEMWLYVRICIHDRSKATSRPTPKATAYRFTMSLRPMR